jgi:alpha-tubulin suppressor-like RCC1 family protein
MSNRTMSAVGVSLCACLMWPTAALATGKAAAGTHHAKDVRLRIVVRALPRPLSAKIVLTGPHHLRKLVARSVSLELPVGVWTLAAAPVRAKAGAYYATVPRVRERLVVGKPMTATVSYATLVPKTTKIVPASDTVSLAGEPSGPRTLTLDGTAAREAKVGEYLASGVTPAAPDGYLVKVVSLAHSGGGRVMAAVEDATLLEALPSGEIASEEVLEPPAEAEAASVSRHGALALARAGARGPTAHAADFILHTTNLTCESGAGVHVESPSVTFTPSMAIHAHWGFFKLDSASFTATVAASLEMGAEADAGAHCETNDPGIGLFPHEISLPDIDVQVGPVPVVITPKLQVYLSGSASITAKVSFSIEQSASATVGVSYEHGRFSPIESFPQHFKQSFTPEGDASAELALTPTVDTLIYGVAGPSFDLGAAAKFDADTTKTPWWSLQGCLEAGLGFVISPLDLNWSDPHLIQLCKTLLRATSGPPGSGPTGTSPGGPGAPGTPPPGFTGTCEKSGCEGSATNPLTGATAVTSGIGNSCALLATHMVACWGADDDGELGNGKATNLESNPTPSLVSGIDTATQVSMGNGHTCAVLEDGEAKCWGSNYFGMLGDGKPEYQQGATYEPVGVAGLTDVRGIAAGGAVTCALLTNGHVDCWGADYNGQLGDGALSEHGEQDTPIAVSGITDAVAISAGKDEHVCALLGTGHIDCWGPDSWGQLGNGTPGPEACEEAQPCSATPVEAQGISGATQVSAGVGNTCALLTGGSVECWGEGVKGALGDFEGEESATPVPVPGLPAATSMSMGQGVACADLVSGGVDCWGAWIYGIVDGKGITHAEATPEAGLTDPVEVAAGFGQACAVVAGGGVDCWGGDLQGQLGNGFGGVTAAGFSDTPVAVASP